MDDEFRIGDSISRSMDNAIRIIELRLKVTKNTLAIREKELLDLKGPCSNTKCPLHYAHSGPCSIKK
jgi:hypothetical protein